MIFCLGFCLVVGLTGLVIVVLEVCRAPCGWEDGEGFHERRKDG